MLMTNGAIKISCIAASIVKKKEIIVTCLSSHKFQMTADWKMANDAITHFFMRKDESAKNARSMLQF